MAFIIASVAIFFQITVALLSLRIYWKYGRHWLWAFIPGPLLFFAIHNITYLHQESYSSKQILWAISARFCMAILIVVILTCIDRLLHIKTKANDELVKDKRDLMMQVERRMLDLEMEVADRKQAQDTLKRDHERFAAIITTQYEIATAEHDLNSVMDLIVERTQTLTGATGAILEMLDGDEMVSRSVSGRANAFRGTRSPMISTIAGTCIESGQILRCDDVERDSRINLNEARRIGARSMIVAPLHYETQIIGALQVVSPERYAFTASDGQTLQMMAGLIGAAMSHNAQFEAKKSMLAEALEKADLDPLTGLLNHRAFHRRLEEESDRAQRTNTPLAVVIMDMNNFKFFNDSYGHTVGDNVLHQVASALRMQSRSEDTLARYGGDEFAMLVPGIEYEDAQKLEERLSRSLDGVGFRPDDYDAVIPLTLSVGIAVYPTETPSRLEALELADARLRRNKSGAGDQAVNYRNQFSQSLTGFSMLDALVTAVDAKDRYTSCHSEDVLQYGLEIARELGLDEEMQHKIQLAALLHDVGKIGVPDNILRKPGRLTEQDFEAIKQHPVMGSVIVGAVPGFEEILDGVRHHHERWDGKGYPSGLVGTEIPFLARLLAVADAFSAMTTDRPYRKGMGEDVALNILREGAGSQWDADCVQALLSAREKRTQVPEELKLAA